MTCEVEGASHDWAVIGQETLEERDARGSEMKFLKLFNKYTITNRHQSFCANQRIHVAIIINEKTNK